MTLRVTAWNGWYLWARGVDRGLLAKKIVGNLSISNPNVHFTADGESKETIVLIRELAHGVPWGHRVDIVNASDVRNSTPWSRNEFETGWWLVLEKISDKLKRSYQQEDACADKPFVGANGVPGLGVLLEQGFSGNVVLNIMLDLGHNDRGRH